MRSDHSSAGASRRVLAATVLGTALAYMSGDMCNLAVPTLPDRRTHAEAGPGTVQPLPSPSPPLSRQEVAR